MVTFTLLDRPKTVGGNVVIAYPEKGLMGALAALRNSVNYGEFKVQFQGGKFLLIKINLEYSDNYSENA